MFRKELKILIYLLHYIHESFVVFPSDSLTAPPSTSLVQYIVSTHLQTTSALPLQLSSDLSISNPVYDGHNQWIS